MVTKLRLAFAATLFALASPSAAQMPTSILFIGNSFTFGAGATTATFHPELVRDLNKEAASGVPALFQTFARQMGHHFVVSLETSPGKPLSFHYEQRRDVIAGKWDVVILQGYSTLDPERPGEAARHLASARDLVRLFRAANPEVKIDLVSTWSRADLTYPAGKHWSGKPIEAMADDLATASALALRGPDKVDGVVPVGQAWTRAIREAVADPNPYDGIDPGKTDLWAADHYHASNAGYYLEALTIFGAVTGVDPLALGPNETAAAELAITPELARRLQQVAHDELAMRKP